MTSDQAVGLIREGEGPQRATLLELFLDLVFVAALALTSRTLAESLDRVGVFRTVALLMAIWWVWSVTALVTDLYHAQRPPIFVMTLWVMLGTILMAGSLPGAFTDHALVFAGAYVVIQLGRGIFLVAALHARSARLHASRFIFWFAVSAVPWLAGGLMAGPARGLLWAAALAIDYGSAWLRYPTPRLGRVPTSQYRVAADHLAERYQQFFTLTLGDLILITTLTYADNDVTTNRTAALLVAFAATVLLWQIYVHRAGSVLQAAIESSRDPGGFVRSAPNTHLLMVAGVVAASAGFEVVIAHPTEHTTPWLAGVILGGPALFLAGRARFEYEVFSRVSPSRLVALLVLAAAAPALTLTPALVAGLAATLVLAGVAIADAIRAHGNPSEPPAPSM
ncbi:low temperature requirement protein A [Micromonospora globispora]|uniref:Low temperature requirement protein A n=1 Tax=Micromonospora globispora TaxID=1450148 RepID=A0A317JYF8_9ACTN|nr:low temperature requirement protein A [Micromonospora globispora]PWU45054.1 low temperature requirement protein A [Micromonospora globispora]PWU55087.1 low temperature requirement protein A [Micromonospora globispora]RQW83047.1 low temperature requirement protein A [Micromonospora globispora]